MSQYRTDLFRTNCGVTAPLEINLSGPGWNGGERRLFEQPFALIGRHERSCLRLEDAAVSQRHVYLQQLGGRVFCVDLGSRTGIRWGGVSRPAGWLRKDQGIQVGPFTLELAMAAQAGGGQIDEVAEEWDPLQDRVSDPQLLPWITVERDNKVMAQMRMNRALVLVGSSPACRLRLREAGVSRYHCSLVRTPEGVWMIDLLNDTGTCLNGQPVPWALVEEGGQLQVGPYLLRFSYQNVSTATPSYRLSEMRAETPAESSAVPLAEQFATEVFSPVPALEAELDQARARLRDAEVISRQLADSQGECVRLGDQVRVLEIQVAQSSDLQSRLEAAQVSARQLEIVRAERDQWQAEAQILQTRLASEAAEREEWQIRLEEAQQQLVEEREASRAAGARLEQESAALQSVRADLAARNSECSVTSQQLQETQDALARSQDKARDLQTELEQAHERLQDEEQLRQQLADIRAEHDELCARVPELEERAASADQLRDRVRAADTEMEKFSVQLRAAESQAAELAAMRAECVRLRDRVGALEIQVADTADLQVRLEAAQASARKLDIICAERDQWQAEVQTLQTKLASNSTEQAWAKASDLERALTEATETHKRTVAEVRGRWESERKALEARFEEERQAHNGAAQAAARDVQIRAEAAIRELQVRAVAEREEWRKRVDGAEAQIMWERGLFQEQSEKLRQQAASLQMERDRLAARLAQAESSLRAAEERSRSEAGDRTEPEHLRQLAIRDQIFVEFGTQMRQLLVQAARAPSQSNPADTGAGRQ